MFDCRTLTNTGLIFIYIKMNRQRRARDRVLLPSGFQNHLAFEGPKGSEAQTNIALKVGVKFDKIQRLKCLR